MTTANAKTETSQRAALRRNIAKAARWLHIYLSMASFFIVLFFAVTGITLNHPDWGSHSVRTRQLKGFVAGARAPVTVDSAAQQQSVVAALQAKEHLHGRIDDLKNEDSVLTYSYRAPGYSADVLIDGRTGAYSVVEVRNGLLAVINDLHKGRDSGAIWKWFIDISAALLALVSFTGLVILFFLYKRRTPGVIIAVLGLVFMALLFKAFVP